LKTWVDAAVGILNGTAMPKAIHVVGRKFLKINLTIPPDKHVYTNVNTNGHAGLLRNCNHVLHDAIINFVERTTQVEPLHGMRQARTLLKVNSCALTIALATATWGETPVLIKTSLVFIHLSPTYSRVVAKIAK
jgi:hypothetical protein